MQCGSARQIRHCARLATLLIAALPRAAAAAGVGLDYEVRWGPVTVLEVHNTTRHGDDWYEATSEMRTVGVVALFLPWNSTSRTAGSGSGATLLPQTHRTHGALRGAERTVEIDYGAGGSVAARIAPAADDEGRDPVPVELQQATIDPLTSGLMVVASDCRGTQQVFDGRRRYDLVLSDLGQAEVPDGAAVYRGMARHCRAAILPLTGYWRRDTREDERPMQIDAWIAAPRPDLPPVPVYLEISAARGTLGIHLTGARLLDPIAAADTNTPSPVTRDPAN
ncbi:MAG: DUF3108 domain-containing protein [bacterium]